MIVPVEIIKIFIMYVYMLIKVLLIQCHLLGGNDGRWLLLKFLSTSGYLLGERVLD